MLQCYLAQAHHILDLLINLTDNGKAKLLVISQNRGDGKDKTDRVIRSAETAWFQLLVKRG